MNRFRKATKRVFGFTMIELLIAVTLTTVIIGAALKVYLVQHKSMMIQSKISDMQINIRSSLNELTTKIRLAGLRVPQTIDAIVACNTDPDTLTVTYDTGYLKSVYLTSAMSSVSDDIRCDHHEDDLSTIHEGDWLYIYDAAAGVGEYFQASRILEGPARVRHDGSPLSRIYPAGSQLLKLNQTKYYIDGTTDPDHPCMVVCDIGGTPKIYGDNVMDLQFKYVQSDNSVVDIPILPEMVREVIIDIGSRSENIDRDFGATYRDRRLSTTVMVRNLALN